MVITVQIIQVKCAFILLKYVSIVDYTLYQFLAEMPEAKVS